MFAAFRRDWSSCLLVLLAVCILGGQFHQLACRLDGCKPAATVQADGDDHGSPAGGHDNCACQCHFLTLVPTQFFASFVPSLPAWSEYRSVRDDRAPDSPCADIEHPPQLLRA